VDQRCRKTMPKQCRSDEGNLQRVHQGLWQRIRSSQRKRKRLIFLLHVAVNQATASITVATTTTIIEATNTTAMIADLIIVIQTIDAMIVVDVMTRTQGTASPTTRRMIASVITLRKRVMRPCTMTSLLCQEPAACPEKGVDLDLLRALDLVLALAQAAEATKTIMLNNMIRSRAQHPNAGVRTPRTTTMDITIARTRAIAFLPPSLLQRQREVIAPRNRESHQQSRDSLKQVCMISTSSLVQVCMISTSSLI
jgi:hypothetical protein